MSATVAQVQASQGTGVSTGPVDVALTVGAAVGGIKSTLVVFCGHDDTNGTAPTITTQAGTTGSGWVGPIETKRSNAAVQKMYMFYNLGVAAGSSTTRMVLSGGGDEARMLVVAEITGSAGLAPVSVSNDQEGDNHSTTLDLVLSTTLNPNSTQGVLVGFSLNAFLTGTGQPTAGVGFTDDGIFCAMSGTFTAPASLRVEHLAITSSAAVEAKFRTTETTAHLTFAAFLADPPTILSLDNAPRPGRTSRISTAAMSSISGARELLPLAAAAVVVQAPPSDTQPLRRAGLADRGAVNVSAPLLPLAATVVDMSWMRASPLLVQSRSAMDEGAGTILPLNPPSGTWFPDGPDRPVPRRQERDAPGSGLVRPLSAAAAVVFVAPDDAWAPRRRPSTQDGAALGERPLYLANLSWTAQPIDRAQARRTPQVEAYAPLGPSAAPDLSWAPQPLAPMRRAPVARVDEATVFLPVYQPQAPGWLPQPADVVVRRLRPDQEWPTATLPVFQPQAPSWLVVSTDVVARRRALPGFEVLVQPAPVTGFDLSWAAPIADRPAARRPVLAVDAVYPATLTVNILSAWGWIPSVPERPGLRVVVSQPFSDRQDPILVAPLLIWGWLPSGPDRPAPRVVVSQPFSDRLNPITVNVLSAWGWLPDGPDRPAVRSARSQDPVQVPGAPSGLPAWGWSVPEDARARRPVTSWEASSMVPGPTASTWGWLPGAPDQRVRRNPLLEAAAAFAPGPIPGASLEWAAQPAMLAALARRPQHEQAQVVRALVVPGMEWLVHAVHPIARRPVEAPQAAVPQPAIVPLPPWWEPEPPRVVRRARILPDDPQPPPGVLIVPPLLTMLLPSDPGRPARRVVLPVDFSVMPGGVIVPPPPVVLRLFSMVGAVAATAVRMYFGDGTDADA